jgi:uncharacterized membrane protein
VASVDVEVETVIARPVEEVAAYAGDPSNAPEWYANISSVRWRTGPPVRVGSRLDFVARFLGRRIAYTYEVVELEPGGRLVMQTDGRPFPMRTVYAWEAAGDGATRMTLRNVGRPSGFAAVGARPMSAAMRSAMTKDLERLRRRLEAP